MRKLLSVSSIASIATIFLANSAGAEPITYRSARGVYTIDLSAGTYRECLNSGGCISLGRKHLIRSYKPTTETPCVATVWKKGQYEYEVGEGMLAIAKNGRTILVDDFTSGVGRV